MKKNKIRIIFSAVIFLALGGMAFAFWASGIFVNSDEKNINLNVGVAKEVQTLITINDDNGQYTNLVPIGASANSYDEAVEYMIIPLELTWLEEANTDWAEGLKGVFKVEPSVSLEPSDSQLTNLILTAQNLIFPYFFQATSEQVSQLTQGFDSLIANNNNRQLSDFTDLLYSVDANATVDIFEVELVLGEVDPTMVYLLVLIDMPCGETFPYIHGGVIHINSSITHIDNYIENILPTPIFNIGDLISQDDGNKLILGDDNKLFAQPYLGVHDFLDHYFTIGAFSGMFSAIEVQISSATSIVSMWGSFQQSGNAGGGVSYTMISPETYPLLKRFIGQVDQFAMGYYAPRNDFAYLPLRITANQGIEIVSNPSVTTDITWSFQFVLILTDSENDGHIDD